MKNQIIEIRYPENMEYEWEEQLDKFLRNLTRYDNFLITTITDEVQKLRRVISALQDESDTRVPKGFNQKSEDYAPRVAAHNAAIMELTHALIDVGYRE